MDQFLSLQNQQQHEQMIAGLRQMTVAIRAYHRGLIEQGFKTDEAFALILAFQTEMIRTGKQQQEGA